MTALVECVPNFSEGRDADVVRALCETAEHRDHVALLDVHTDPDHNRTVLTIAGAPEPVADTARALARVAVERIDVSAHEGVHPWIGALDVCPFIPLRSATREDCVRLAESVGGWIGSELSVPVFFYEQAATRPERANLAEIRRGGAARLRAAIETDPDWTPDRGPTRWHPTAGASVVGARGLLVAFNIVLETGEIEIARQIARRIRERDGGLPAVKALGFRVHGGADSEVSMNLVDTGRSSIETVVSAIEGEAKALGTGIASGELVGLLSQAAFDGAGERARSAGWILPDDVLEARLRAKGLTD